MVPASRSTGSRRPVRVLLVLGGVVILSGMDLLFTVLCITTVGLFEHNPIVVSLVQWAETPLILVPYKLVTVGISVALILWQRRAWQAEAAAWAALAMLIWLSYLWSCYIPVCFDPAVLAHSVEANQFGIGQDYLRFGS